MNQPAATTQEDTDSKSSPVQTDGSVRFNSQLGKWAAAIPIGGRMKFLGYFETEEEAANKIAEAAKTWALTLRIRRNE